MVKGQLAINEPNLDTDTGLGYEEGEGLEDDTVERNQTLLPMLLAELPGGGLKDGTVVVVSDQSQHINFDLIIAHRVSSGVGVWDGIKWVVFRACCKRGV